jgi:hypothetical protein
MKVRDIRNRNKRRHRYAYTYQFYGSEAITRVIATRSLGVMGLFHLLEPAPVGSVVTVTYAPPAGVNFRHRRYGATKQRNQA